MSPCPKIFVLKDKHAKTNVGDDVFQRTENDDEPGLSQEDKECMTLMSRGFTKTSRGNWSAPLPFCKDRPRLPSIYVHTRQRAENLGRSLKRDPTKKHHFVEFIEKIFENKHAERALPLEEGEEHWYLPIFGVYHPKKPSKICVVFDLSAKCNGISLNDVLLNGPDLTNNLLGVLMRFWEEKVAVTGDIKQMFFNFEVNEKHRIFLKFLWFQDSNIEKPIIEYRMRVHVFGNAPSSAVATLGMRMSVFDHDPDSTQCDKICEFVKNSFYVDNGLVSLPDVDLAVNLMLGTQQRLREGGNLILHKVASNDANVLARFPKENLAKEINFDTELQRSLGLSWDMSSDTFTYQLKNADKPYPKRGILSTVNSVFDPLGFVAPVFLQGRLIIRAAMADGKLDWDEPLPGGLQDEWETWKESLNELQELKIPRQFTNISFQQSENRELQASKVGFVIGKSKVAALHRHTIPRLELCAAVLATELATFIKTNLSIPLDSVSFYTDSQVVLGYINNETRRFHVYIGNRVDRIRRSSLKTKWYYVPTSLNPEAENQCMATRTI